MLWLIENIYTDIRLVDSPPESPHIGRVQLLHDDDKWLDVCFYGDDFGDFSWDITTAMVACRQLGYPGVASRKYYFLNDRNANTDNGDVQALDSFFCRGGKLD